MKNKIVSLILLICSFLITYYSVVTTSYAASYGTCGTKLSWKLDDSGKLTISGTGEMTHFIYEYYYYNGNKELSVNIPWYYYRDSITSVEILEGVTSIGGHAFCGCSSLTSITIPESVTSIGGYAFYGCSSLTSVEIPNSVASISTSAFSGCSSLTSITIPESVTSIGDYAFSSCSGLSSITIPENVTSISSYAFRGCSGLTSVELPNSVTSIGRYAFENCSSLESIEIPNSVTSIGSNAFSGCLKLNSIVASFSGYNLTTLGVNNNDSLSITITNRTSIDYQEFSGYSNLKSITIPDSVTTIESQAFYNCSGLTSFEIPKSVTSIGSSAFYGCTLLNGVYITDIESWCNIQFENDTSNPLFFANKLYVNSNIVESVVIPNSITEIKPYAFCQNYSLTDVTIPNSVTSIGDYAFSDCSSLTNITIPDSVTSIGEGVFDSCVNLKSITTPFVGASRDSSGFDGTLHYWFGENSSKGLYSAGLYSGNYRYIPSSLNKITITDDDEISNKAFCDCYKIKEIEIGSKTTAIAREAFAGCEYLKKIIIPSSVEVIGNDVFDIADCVTIYGKKGSYAESYAKRNNISFSEVDTKEIEDFEAEINNRNEYISVSTSVPNIEEYKNIHAVVYDKNGKMIDYIIFPSAYSNNTVHFAFKKAENASYIKVFLWDSFSKLTPLCDSITLNVE